MPTDPPRPAAPRRRRSGCLWILLAAAAVVALICGGVFLGQLQSGRELDRDLARLRAAGEPTTLEELDAFYALPPADQDVTALILEAVASWPASVKEEQRDVPLLGSGDSIPLPGQPWPALPAAEKVLARHAAVLEKLHLVARRDGLVRFPVKFQDGMSAKMPDYKTLARFPLLLMLEAHVRVRRGDPHGAAESIGAILGASRPFRRTPLLIVQLVRIAAVGNGKLALEPLLGTARFAEEDLGRLQAGFEAVDFDEGMLAAMLAERAVGCTIARDPAAAFQSPAPGATIVAALSQEGARAYLEWMNRTIDAMRLPLPERLDEAAAIDAEIEDFAARAGAVAKLRYAFALNARQSARILIPRAAEGLAKARVTAAAIAAWRFRLRHGELPARLEELVPEFLAALPLDPFDGKPLRCAVRDKEILIYSIGADRIDDGGRPAQPQEGGDLVFVLGVPGQQATPRP